MRKVSIVMESGCLRCSLEKELQRRFEVSVCGNTDAGADLLRDQPDILVMDLSLPGIDGLTFLKQHKGILPPIIIVLSVLTSPDVLRELAELGVSSVIRRPCTISMVMGQLEKHI